MLTNPVFQAEKDKLWGNPFIMLIEFDYFDDVGDPQKVRLAQYTEEVVYDGATYTPAAIANIEMSQNMNLEIAAFDIAVGLGGNDYVMDALLEYYDIINTTGRVKIVHVDHLADPTHHEQEEFTIVQARSDEKAVTVSVSPVGFDPIDTTIPARRVTRKEFPGVAINRNLSR